MVKLESWRQLSEDSLLAAETLLREGRYRSCVSRAYCAITHEVVQKLTTFSHGRNNPSHEKLTAYVQNNLTIPQTSKSNVNALIGLLRYFREDADYRPQVTVDEPLARGCVRNAAAIQRELWGDSR